MTEVTQRFAVETFLLEVHEQRHQRLDDVFLGYQVLVDEIQAISEQPTADQDRVLPFRLAHQTNVTVVRPRTPVGATCHANRKFLVGQTQPGQLHLHLIDHSGQRPFGLRDR